MKISKNFSLSEFTYSRTAIENAIDNTPGEAEVHNIQHLVTHLLQPLRDLLGAPVAITSGYRSPAVNRLAGGVADSQHVTGEAADCYCEEGPEKLLQVLKDSELEFDQAIIYKKKKFLHLSVKANGGNRMMVLAFA